MAHRLSDYFGRGDLTRDGSFAELGHADSSAAGTLAYCDSVHYLDRALDNPNVTCLITTPGLAAKVKGKGLVAVAEPRRIFYGLHERLHGSSGTQTRIHPSAIVSSSARIGEGVVIEERAVIKSGVELGDRCFVDSGAVIGAEGLLYYEDEGGYRRVRHAGGVRVGSGATILANAVVAKGIHPTSPTIIGSGSLVGVLSTVGHEARVGDDVAIAGNCVIARRAHIGARASIGSSCTIREYVRVGARARVNAGSVVIDDVPDDAVVSGNFAVSHARRLLQYARDRKP